MKIVIVFILLTSIFIIFFACESLIEPLKTEEQIPYMQLNLGDIRQYYDDPEGFYIQVKIIDTTKRVDGKKVFIIEQAILLPDGIYRGNGYFFLDDKYFYQTELDTLTDPMLNEVNPFNEQKIAEIMLQNGDFFITNDGASDSDKVFLKVNIIDSLATYCETFKEVAEYEMIDNDTSRSFKAYYAKYFGHIGSVFGNKNGFAKVFATYLKVGNKEIGEFVQFKSKKVINTNNNKFNVLSYLIR